MMPRLQLLLLLSIIFFAGLGLSISNVMRAQRRIKRFQSRIGAMLEPHLRTAISDSGVKLRLGTKTSVGTVQQRLAALIGYDHVRKQHHPLPWQAVVCLGLLPAYLGERIASSYIGMFSWIVFVALWFFVCRRFFKWSDQKLAATLYKQFPDALAMIVRSVRVGIPVTEAVRVVGRESPQPTSQEFIRVGHELSIGVPLDRSLRDLAERSGLPEYRFFATALSLQSQTGGALGETLEGLADTIRKRVAARARGKALAAEARTSALVLTLLPIAVGILLFLVNPTYMTVLIVDPMGKRVLGLAVGLLITGTMIMRSMIKKSLA